MFDWNIMKCEEVAEKSGGREGYTVSPTEGNTTHTECPTEITSESFPPRSRQPGCSTRQQMSKLAEKTSDE